MPKVQHRPIPQLTEKQLARFWNSVKRGAPDECWPWIGSRDKEGYGHIKFDYRGYRAIRIAVFLATGKDPMGYCVMHSCNYPPCTNPGHLSPGSDADNHSFRIGNPLFSGEHHGCAKLTQKQVDEIRALASQGGRYLKLAAQYGVTAALISKIVRGQLWSLTVDPALIRKHVMVGETHPHAKLTENDVREIRNLAASGEKLSTLARQKNISVQLAWAIINRRIWKSVD